MYNNKGKIIVIKRLTSTDTSFTEWIGYLKLESGVSTVTPYNTSSLNYEELIFDDSSGINILIARTTGDFSRVMTYIDNRTSGICDIASIDIDGIDDLVLVVSGACGLDTNFEGVVHIKILN